MSTLRNPTQKGSRPVRGPRSPSTATLILSVCAATLVLELAVPARGQQATSLNGPPVQVIPTASEPGVPSITISPGTPNPCPGSDGTGTGGTGSDGTGGTGTGGNVGDSSALGTMLGTSWGATAISNAQALGLNPSALAATCVMESGCVQPANGGSGAQGVFQMFPEAFHEGLATALAANPNLASQIVQGSGGVNDPTTAAIAASGYLMQANTALQNAGVSNPTVLDARSYYEFGPTYGPQVATAPPSNLMRDIVPQRFMTNNNIASSATVAQWQASVTAKVGSAAAQSLSL